MSNEASAKTNTVRWVLIAGMAVAAFVGAYGFAAARNGSVGGGYTQSGASASATPGTGSGASAADVAGGSSSDLAGTYGDGATAGVPAAGGCCGGGASTGAEGVTGDVVEGAATVEGDVQKIDVDVSSGLYDPNVIKLKAGIPAEITFANGAGCTQQVASAALKFSADMSGGPATVKLPALEAGTYPFYCGMQMVFGKIVVE